MKKLFLIGALLISNLVLAAPETPTGLCINSLDCNPINTHQPGVFPGTNLKFFPGFVVSSSNNEDVANIEARWQKLFSGKTPAGVLRKVAYRPKGIYAGVRRNLAWQLFYHDQNKRPANPENHEDPAYNWEPIDSVFNINAVKNEGVLVDIYIRDVADGRMYPKWLENSPFHGVMPTGGPHGNRTSPKYYRYAAIDKQGKRTDTDYPIVEEFVAFHKALRNHLIANGNIDKVMMVKMEETFKAKDNLPSDWNEDNFHHGSGLRNSGVAKVWAASRIPVLIKSVFTGGKKGVDIRALYTDTPLHGAAYPDMKMNNTDYIESSTRFTHPLTGKRQENIRPLVQSTENNGQRANTYFTTGIENPWGYSNERVPQTASHILWALSGPPTAHNKDSGLGQVGEDPQGLMPVHTIIIDFERDWHSNSPTAADWQKAIDTFGPPGTGAFPYLPPGYQP